MLEVKVNVQALELAEAITALAAAMRGADIAPIQSGAADIPPPANPTPPQSAVPAAPTTPYAPSQGAAPAAPTTTPAANSAAPVTPSSVPTAPPPAFSRDQITTAGAALIDAGKINELMGLLNSFGVQAVTQLKPEQLGAFATELRKLGAQI